jgi:tetratricopeptide (TPR) repeat protein
MDLLDFEAQGLYFEQEDVTGIKELIATAADNYANGDAELPLLKAYFLAPESLNVLVALNRFYYYQHRLEEALTATCKALEVIRPTISFPDDWRELEASHINDAPADLLTKVRLYLFTLKAVGFLNMRLENLDFSRAIFEKLVGLDSKDRIGAKGLLELIIKRQSENSGFLNKSPSIPIFKGGE